MTDPPRSLKRKISPPPVRKPSAQESSASVSTAISASLPAAVEAGQVNVKDHLQYWSNELALAQRTAISDVSRLSMKAFRDLYSRNEHNRGHRFVIHQHDHPVSGVHYDLRLQFSETSSLSFSIPYGVPGNANSIRPNRMAIETRVHNVWNNLIESASHATGSLMIWDIGEYEVRPRYSQIRRAKETDDEISADSDNDRKESSNIDLMSEPEKLRKAFQDRHVHLRLHGTRLPPGYTIAMRLPRQNYRGKQPEPPKRRRRKKEPQAKAPEPETTDSDTSISTSSTATSSANEETAKLKEAAVASDDEDRDAVERELIRANNAYPGATNDIGSIHQRQWFLSLDREASGFVKERSGPDKGRWVRTRNDDGTMGGFETFFVQGREVERSIVTGRMAMDIMDDAGMKGYKGRKMWRAITE